MTSRDADIEHPLERLIFFSDAVFAIAITLLVIEIHVPVLGHVSDAEFGEALIQPIPSFFGFVLSFFVIARFWTGHHAAFSVVARYDESLMWPNIVLLMTIVFMPFATAFMAQNIGTRMPTGFYNLSLLATAICNHWVVRRATQPHLVRAGTSAAWIALLRHRGIAVILGAFLAFLWGLYAPQFSQIALISIPFWLAALTRWHVRRHGHAATDSSTGQSV